MTEKTSVEDSAHNLPVFSVTELSRSLKNTLEQAFPRVRVRGEITGFKRAASGHMYFRLKDDDAVLDAVCWRGTAGRLSVAPDDGMEVVAVGRVTAYAGRSNYQIVVDSIELAGQGALLKLLDDRRKKLAAEGLFDIEAKQDLPYLPGVIGVVSSPTGAVIRDILHRLDDRFPSRVLLWPVAVQGDAAAGEIAAAIDGFNALPTDGTVPRPDLLIVARGGGSLEDLMAFNEEIVVRAAAACTIPLISAIGHETDTTLIDHAADVRAPTPTAAAEMAVPVRTELQALVLDDGARLVNAVNRTLADGRLRLDGLARGLPNLRRVVEAAHQRLDDWDERLRNSLSGGLRHRRARLAEAVAGLSSPARRIDLAAGCVATEARALTRAGKHMLDQRQTNLGHLSSLLDSFSYERVLERGFALVTDAADEAVASVKGIKPGMDLNIRFRDGEVATVAAGKPAKRKSRKKPGGEDDQGSLL
ncbi:MAG: exodeoxyribonuclease VII large subunit [Alphaproteobacteria bacterium]